MYERLKLMECNSLAHFINEAVLRIQNSASMMNDLRLARAGLIDLQPAVILNDKGNDIMSLAPQVAPQAPQPVAQPFNFDKPAIADIKHVYGVPVSHISLNGITSLLTQRQGEVERLKSLPHKPEVIKANIAKLKADIKSLLALANELFPVVE